MNDKKKLKLITINQGSYANAIENAKNLINSGDPEKIAEGIRELENIVMAMGNGEACRGEPPEEIES